jgi:hypothetical protein
MPLWLGADFIGQLECSGIGEPLPSVEHKGLDNLKMNISAHNQCLLKVVFLLCSIALALGCLALEGLSEGKHAEELLAITKKDASLKRMTHPVEAHNFDLKGASLLCVCVCPLSLVVFTWSCRRLASPTVCGDKT